MIATGSREWGEPREGVSLFEMIHETEISAQAIGRLIDRYVLGLTHDFGKRDRGAKEGPGLVVVQGEAPGLDTHVAEYTKTVAAGLRRRIRADWKLAWLEPEIARGLWLEGYPADWKNRPRHLAGPERNQLMLDKGADRVLAFFAKGRFYGPSLRGGTNDMVRRAHAAGVPVDIYDANERQWRKP